MDKETSKSLHVGSFISTILIIAIHYNSKSVIPVEGEYSFNYYFQEFIMGGGARIAVPYFALLSGFFASRSCPEIGSYKSFLIKKAHTLFIPYVIGSYLIFYSSSFLAILLKEPESLTLVQILSCSKGLLAHPSSEQLWYLRDLLILSVVVPFLILTPRKLRIAFSIVLGVLWMGEIQFLPLVKGWYLISIETLFFFTLGGVIGEGLWDKMRERLIGWTFVTLLAVWLILNISRIGIKPDFFIWYSDEYTLISLLLYKVAILLGIPLLYVISYRFRDNAFLLFLSGFNFFVYLYHFFPLFYFRKLTGLLIPGSVSFYIDFPLAVLITYGTGFALYRIFPRLFKIITGARFPVEKKE